MNDAQLNSGFVKICDVMHNPDYCPAQLKEHCEMSRPFLDDLAREQDRMASEAVTWVRNIDTEALLRELVATWTHVRNMDKEA